MNANWYTIIALCLAAPATPAQAQGHDTVRVAHVAPAVTRDSTTTAALSPRRDATVAGVRTHTGALRGEPVTRTRWQGAARGARMGALVGVGATLVASAFAVRADRRSDCGSCVPSTPFVVATGVLGTLGTTLFGAGIGAAAPGEITRPTPR